MKVIECEQGSHEWHQARLGLPTASNIHKLFTPKGKQSANETRRTYARALATEIITKRPSECFSTYAMQRGTELEPQARIRYYLDTKRSVQEVGFVLADSGLTGCSPDGLVGDDGAIEIKCFELPHYTKILTTGDIDHAVMMQCHHTLYVTGRKWIDFVMFTDVIPFDGKCVIKRIHRDETICAAIDEAVQDFAKEVDDYKRQLIAAAGLTEDMLMFEAPVFSDGDKSNVIMTDTEGGEL